MALVSSEVEKSGSGNRTTTAQPLVLGPFMGVESLHLALGETTLPKVW